MLTNLITIENATAHAADLAWDLNTDDLPGLRGPHLFNRLFPDGDPRDWYQALTGPLLIQDDDTTSALWESMHDGDGFTALTRGLASPVHEPKLDEDDPRQPTPINLQARIDLLLDLEGADFPAEFHIRRHISAAELEETLSADYDILHLTAHGHKGGIALENRDWTCDRLETADLARISTDAGLRLVVLESCLTAVPDKEHNAPAVAEAVVRAGVPLALAMAGEVHGDLANVFTNRLYEHIAAGRDIIESSRLARLRMHQLSESRPIALRHWALPALFVHRRLLTIRHSERDDSGRPRRPSTVIDEEPDPSARTSPLVPALATLLAPKAQPDARVTLTGDAARWPEPLMKPSPTFVGRGPQLADIASKLDPESPTGVAAEKLLLTGHGGIGKTELALQAADRLRRWFPDGLICVTGRDRPVPEGLELAGDSELLLVEAPRQLVETLAQRLQIEFAAATSDADLVRQVAAEANHRRMLLLFDNLEPLADSPLVTTLLKALGRRSRVLATSRHAFERTRLPVIDVPPLSEADAADMVSARAIELHMASLPDARRLARACRQTPLVIALAVGRIAEGHSEERVIKDLEAFEGDDVEELVKYAFSRTLHEATEHERLLFRCAALYAGPPRRAALQHVAALDDRSFEQALTGALRLSLLEDAPRPEPAEALLLSEPHARRVALLPLARAVAEWALRDDSNARSLRLQAAEESAEFLYLCDALARPEQVREASREGGALAHALARFGAPAPLASAALTTALAALDKEWAIAAGFAESAFAAQAWELVARFAHHLAKYLRVRSLWAAWERLCRLALDSARQEANPEREALALNSLGIVYRELGRPCEAIRCCKNALAISRHRGDPHRQQAALTNLGGVYTSLARWDDAIGCFNKARAICRSLEDRHGEATALAGLGIVYRQLERWEEAVLCCEEALEAFRTLGDSHAEGQALINLGPVYHRVGRWQEALDCYHDALAILPGLGDRHCHAQALHNLATLYSTLGRPHDAVVCYEASLQTKRDLRDRHGEAQTLNNLGAVHRHQGRRLAAIECCGQALAIFRELGARQGMVHALRNLALAHYGTEDATEGNRAMAEAMQWSLELHETQVVETTQQCLHIAKFSAGAAAWQPLATLAKALANEIQKPHQQGFPTKEIEAAAKQSLNVFDTIGLVAEAQADPQHPAFTKARTLAQQLDESSGNLYDLTTWLNDLRAPD